MGINYNKEYFFTYHPLVLKTDIPKLDNVVRDRIKISLERKLIISPSIYGIPLHGVLSNYRKFRVGDYRVIFIIIKNEIRILAIGHRSGVYEIIGRRI